jgi:hypothetical protein
LQRKQIDITGVADWMEEGSDSSPHSRILRSIR